MFSQLHGSEIMRPPTFTCFTSSSLTSPDTPHLRAAFAGTDGYSHHTCDRQDPLFSFLFFSDGACCLGSMHVQSQTPMLAVANNQDSEEQVCKGECVGGGGGTG